MEKQRTGNTRNPILERIQIGSKEITVVRDDLLPGGTKEAALGQFINELPEVELVYAGPRQGYAQIALAAACLAVNKRATLFLASSKVLHPCTEKAISLGATVKTVSPGYLSVVQARARSYCKENSARLMPFGLACEEMVAAIATRALSLPFTPSEVWSVAGSGTLQRGLQRAWPTARFYAVQIGKEPNAGIARVILAPEKYEQSAKSPPPFPSCANYDAKAWQHILSESSNETLFWNVAS
tara:strand:+ start:2838 stop:3560 length:723 start_codon:yes stop_codon:yes gene_type:complete